MRLSILIPTLETRKDYLDRIMSILNQQKQKDIEILIEQDNREKTIGEKRNILVSKAKGDYISFVDDDDIVSYDYTDKILQSTSASPDCVGIHLLHCEDGILKGFTYHSLRYNHWYDDSDNVTGFKRYYRNPNHLNPIKRELASICPFPNISMGEDKVYSSNILKLLKTEVYIYEPIYMYMYRSKK